MISINIPALYMLTFFLGVIVGGYLVICGCRYYLLVVGHNDRERMKLYKDNIGHKWRYIFLFKTK